jgi:hypothetical protein
MRHSLLWQIPPHYVGIPLCVISVPVGPDEGIEQDIHWEGLGGVRESRCVEVGREAVDVEMKQLGSVSQLGME